MSNQIRKLVPALFLLATLGTAMPASAGGPGVQSWNPHAEPGQCVPIERTKACERTDLVYLVNKADGSGTTKVALIEDKSLSFSKISKMAKAMGEPFDRKIGSEQKKVFERRSWRGARLPDEGRTIEPALYEYMFPVSDKVALIEPHDLAPKPDDDLLYFVALDGKLDAPVRPGIPRDRLYYIGGYYGNMPAQVFELVSTDEARGTATLRQFDGYGNERAIFDNIVLHQRRDDFDSFELDFFVIGPQHFVVSAQHPITGEPASLWFSADGSVMGYGDPTEPRTITLAGTKDREWTNLFSFVGELPVFTGLKDNRLYYPLDRNGKNVDAPENFIGMARMFDWPRKNSGGGLTRNNNYRGWLLVYELPTGYGYKIADRARTDSDHLSMISAPNVLGTEDDLMMLAGFETAEIEGDRKSVIRLFDRYEADGVTPAAGAVPAGWRQAYTWSNDGLRITAATELGKESYATSKEAFAALRQKELEAAAEYARRGEISRQQMLAWQAEREAQEARYQAEQQARLAREAAQEAEWARKRAQYRPKTGAEEYAERMEEYKRQQSLSSGVRPPFRRKTTECYDQGDGTEKCFTR
ncbi:hypothetical protein [Henriciella litoralis]|uniref:hypothetical protein n=1 Tax=Henriciella litoralis TaxID=568102 RepID=UPI000A02EC3C|nr:hypothetical protein [Henriciella litoralis]